MTIDTEKVTQSIFGAIDEVNEQLPKEDKLEKSGSTGIFGSNGRLDSLGLVSLITTIEQRIEEDFGITVTILENIDELEDDNPFETVSALTNYLTSMLEEKANG
jgi:D-alanine--poly(phosphoribitol) ligase subunit 2